MPTSARWEVTNSPKISVKSTYSAGGQSRPPLQGELRLVVGADDSVGPLGSCEFAEQFCKKQVQTAGSMCTGKRQSHIRNAPSSRTAVAGIDPYEAYKYSARRFELLQISRERSTKTEAVFVVGSRGLRGKIEIPPGSFPFGEAKENAEGQLQIRRSFSALLRLHHLRHRPKNILPSRRFGTRAYLLRGATQIRRRFKASLLRRKTGCAVPGDFGAERLIRMLGGCPSRCCCKDLSASWPSLWVGRKPVLLPRRCKI